MRERLNAEQMIFRVDSISFYNRIFISKVLNCDS